MHHFLSSALAVAALATASLLVAVPAYADDDVVNSAVDVDAVNVDADTPIALAAYPWSTMMGADFSGTITFSIDSDVVGRAAVVDVPMRGAYLDAGLYPVGTYTISAEFSGVAGKTHPSTGTGTLTVTSVATTTTLDVSPAEVTDGSRAVYTANVSGIRPSGSVEFYSDTGLVGISPLIDGIATLTVTPSVGTYRLTAVYNGDTNYVGSTSLEKLFTVNPAIVPPPSPEESSTPSVQQLANTGTRSPYMSVGVAAGAALTLGMAFMLVRRRLTR